MMSVLCLLMVVGTGAPGGALHAQIETGSWQDQPNLTRCAAVAAADGAPIALIAGQTAIYALGLDADGRSTGEVQRFGKADGLSRADLAGVALAPELGLAIIGFDEGTFDLVSVDTDGTLGAVLTVRDLAEADIPGSKRPNDLVVQDDRLLVCTDIGVVEYDLAAFEVRDTWKLESANQTLAIRSALLRGDRWWLATSDGLWSAPLGSPFPGDPATWTQEAGLSGLGVADLRTMAVGVDGRMMLLERREGPDALWLGDPDTGTWLESTAGLEEEWTSLATDGIHLWASTPFGLMEADGDWMPQDIRGGLGNVFLKPNGLSASSGGVWVANAHTGAFRVGTGGPEAAFEGPVAPNGPRSNSSLRLDAWNDRLWVASGGADLGGVPLYRQEGFSGRKGTYWWSVSPPDGVAGGNGVQDPMDVSIDPTRPERAVFASLEEGLVELEGPEVVQYWNPDNAPLEWNAQWDVDRCTVTAIDFDRQGNLWVLNEGAEDPLKLLDAEGAWHVMPIEGLDGSDRFTRVLATQSDQVWVLLAAGGGIMVLSTGGTPTDPGDDDIRFLGQGDGEGGLPSTFVYGVEEDLDGEIWVGTLQGPAVYYQPQALFGSDAFDAQRILIEQDGNFQFLLETETIQDIALDGGNRKWLATVNNGVFLLAPDGREELAHFTAANSPLLSDEVFDIAIDQASGMVYFATSKGITSYRGEATNFRPELDGGGLVVFPNPWKPGYADQVTVDGLAFGSEVHILDASGERVRVVQSAGGRAVWDTLDDRGAPVPEGVYYLLAGEASGKSGATGKMVILR